MTPKCWDIAVDAPIPQLLTYAEPEDLYGKIEAGASVLVPLRGRKVKGLVVEEHRKESSFVVRPISEVEEQFPPLSPAMMSWLKFLSEYYLYPLGRMVRSVHPPLKKRGRQRKSAKAPVLPEVERDEKKILTDEQQKVVEALQGDLNKFATHLIFGVTGSGKTEIYLQLIEKVLKEGKQALVLVPEISLTPQLIQRFTARFGAQVSVLHSQLTDREKTDQWWTAVEGHSDVVIGARSALFCPLPRLGLVVVDEEHESSFKQEESLRYHARDAAIMRAKLEGCPILLGSATPSLESWHRAQEGAYTLHTLKQRATGMKLPLVEIIDMKAERQERGDLAWNDLRPSWMSHALYHHLARCLESGEQAALFLNRRGVAPAVVGPQTGHSPHCPNCDISLTLHGAQYLVCHYCNYSSTTSREAAALGEEELLPLGLGTEQVEADLKQLFPKARLARADRDEITTREQLEELIRQVEQGDVDFLVGTQMISKGLDFPHLSLVALVLADVGFNLPDFRAVEKSFQLLTQVSGRAGRHRQQGLVLIQTLNSQHPCLEFVPQHDYESFAAFELQMRQALSYPPWGKLCAFRTLSLSDSEAHGVSLQLAQASRTWLQREKLDSVEILGPSPCPLAKIRNRYRHQLLLKSSNPRDLRRLSFALLNYFQSLKLSGVQLQVDMDPQNLM